jgi:hypothetical protein
MLLLLQEEVEAEILLLQEQVDQEVEQVELEI